jgi:hypothetical protein
MKSYFKLIIFLFIISITKSNAQLDLSHEFGLFIGPITMQTDYGERNHFPASNQTSFGAAAVHYLSFYGSNYNWRNGASFFSDHFKLRTEVSYYFNNQLEHRSDFIDNNPGALAESFRNMKGSTKIFNIGTQLEYYFKNLEDYGLLFNTADKFSPYLSAGIQYNSFDADVTTAGGGFDISSIPVKFQDDIVLDPESTFSLVMGLGTRYKMDKFDLVLDGRWQYFLSDKVDGVDADEVDGSKFNDTLIFFSVGIVFNLEGLN